MLGACNRPWLVPVPCDELAYVGLELQVEVVLNDVRPHTIHENRSLRRNRRSQLSEADQIVLQPRNVLLVQVRSELVRQQAISLHGNGTGKGQLHLSVTGEGLGRTTARLADNAFLCPRTSKSTCSQVKST